MSLRFALVDDLPEQARSLVALRGPDTVRFLQGTLSADVSSLPADLAVPAGLLTVKGKLVTEAIALAAEEGMDLLVPRSLEAQVAELLDQHVIMDDVAVEARGPVGVGLLWRDGDEPPPDLESSPHVRTFRARHPAPGRLLVGAPEAVLALVQAAARVDAPGWERHRVRTASPAWGHELLAGMFPPEVGFVYGVAYDKGCYMGQEPLARIHARGQVNRVMARVRTEEACAVPCELAHADRPEAGTLTTLVPSEGGYEGLAIVRRTFAEPGTLLRRKDTDEAPAVEVTSGPLGDDPGVASRKRS